ncbi:MAG: hypothetical protein HRT65_03765 [Flavobacteriaceae bacterium]|nr:hypothetical protein [Flavobacteriaceae bacterium]
MSHAIVSYKYNRSLLKERKRKTKEDVFGTPSITQLHVKPSTTTDVLRVREQMRAYNRRLWLKGLLAFIILLTGLSLLVFWLIQ